MFTNRMIRKIKSLLLIIVILTTNLGISNVVTAKDTNFYDCRFMSKSGKFVYYVSLSKEDPKIMRYNTETGKKSVVITNELNGKETGCFYYNLATKGKNIYCVWDIKEQGKLDEYECRAIYRISKDGKKKKRLAYGENIVIRGDRIYYDKLKVKKKNGVKYTKDGSGKRYSMKLDGTDKKKEEVTYYNPRSAVYYWQGGNYYVNKGGYVYYRKDMNELYRKNKKTNKEEKVMSFGKNKEIKYFCLSKDYIGVVVENIYTAKEWMYFSETNGDNRKKVDTYD